MFFNGKSTNLMNLSHNLFSPCGATVSTKSNKQANLKSIFFPLNVGSLEAATERRKSNKIKFRLDFLLARRAELGVAKERRTPQHCSMINRKSHHSISFPNQNSSSKKCSCVCFAFSQFDFTLNTESFEIVAGVRPPSVNLEYFPARGFFQLVYHKCKQVKEKIGFAHQPTKFPQRQVNLHKSYQALGIALTPFSNEISSQKLIK